MNSKYFDKKGEIITINSMIIPKAKEFAELVHQEIIPFIKLTEIKRDNEDEIIIFDMEVEVSQIRKNDIKNKERIAISFNKFDSYLAEVEVLRQDFPQVPHLNLKQDGLPKSICLFNKSYEEIRHNLNPTKILSQIRYWLEATSRGDLHAPDQALEQVMYYSKYTIFLPNNFLDSGKLPLFKTKEFKDKILLIPYTKNEPISNLNNIAFYSPLLITAEPQVHGNIHKTPTNVEELNLLCENWRIDLKGEITKKIENIAKLPFTEKKEIEYKPNLLIIIYIPKKREEEKASESGEFQAFITTLTIKELAQHLGIIETFNNFNAIILGEKDKTINFETISIIHLNIGFLLSKQHAAYYNNECFKTNPNISLIGVGALGSQVCMNLVRSGFGKFNLIDDDWVLPHNAARHILTGNSIGESKTKALCTLANSVTEEEKICMDFQYNILKDKNEVNSILKDSDIILDISTSVAVERYLGIDIESNARRVAVFLSPSGKDLVVLAEDVERESRIDWLEMQYYRYIINESNLTKHITDFPGDIRYSNSCRDTSSRIPNDYVSIHGATASRIIKNINSDISAKIIISQLSTDNYNLITKEYAVYDLIKYIVNEWCICIDEYFINLMQQKRKEKLPNETGGVILGSFDFERKIIYMIDIYCPEDNIEYPTSFIRGCENLKEKIEEISLNTAGNIEYVGEWHSHPNAFSTSMSSDDKELLDYLHEKRMLEGYPGVVIIMNDKNEEIGIQIY